ncbi:hypothetical protein K8T06_03510 [bacterium]|nr:hypothetical protein [bacterium]
MKILLITFISSVFLLAGCASTPLVLPANLENFDLSADCPDEARVVGLDIKATLEENVDHAWLAIHWVPRYYTPREPIVKLTIGVATFMGQKGNVFYYECKTLPNNKKIGLIKLPKATDKYGPKATVIEIYRREGSRCLELRELNRL